MQAKKEVLEDLGVVLLSPYQMTTLEDEPISTLTDPLPLPPYIFEDELTEDENLLTWVSILARHSSSKKGHMGTIFVRPPEIGSSSSGPSSACQPQINIRIAAYANNTPLLYSKSPKNVPEIHAEALAICRSAARAVSLSGCTVYVSFPPCNECFKLLIAAGVKRCVFKKGVIAGEGQGDAVLVAAEVHGIEMVGTLDKANYHRQRGDKDAESNAKQYERQQEAIRDGRVRQFWEMQGEDATKTRGRVTRWWEDWYTKYRAAEKVVHARCGMVKMQAKAVNGIQNDPASVRRTEEDPDEKRNEAVNSVIPLKRPSSDEDGHDSS